MSAVFITTQDLPKFGLAPICFTFESDCTGGGGWTGGGFSHWTPFDGYSGGNNPVGGGGGDVVLTTNTPARMTQCNCVQGEAYQDITGACRCCNGVLVNNQCTEIPPQPQTATPTSTPLPPFAPSVPLVSQAQNIIDRVKSNPLPFLLGAAGLMVLFSGSRKK